MRKIVKIIIFLTGVVLFLLLLLFSLPKQKLEISKVCFEESCFNVEVVSTPLERQKGLMFRDHLDKDQRMLFVFNKEGDYPFWMKNTLIPLDIIWINQDLEVVFIKEDAEPCLSTETLAKENHRSDCPLINPNQKAKYVLEVDKGVVKDINLKLGDKAFLDID